MDSDFNGDGARDTVIADPEATVNGVARAGAVHVVYGGGKGNLQLTQALASVPGEPEVDDRYGFSLAVYDANLDGCSDLVVGIPYEDMGTVRDGGNVHLLYGSTEGLGSGAAAKEFYQGTDKPLGSGQEAGDWTGYSVAAGKTSGGAPFLVIGSPGEDVGTVQDAGMVSYVRGTTYTVANFHQDTDTAGAVPSVPELNDRFGWSIAATPTHFAIGAPGEGVGQGPFAGIGVIFNHTLISGVPEPQVGIAQDSTGVDSEPEIGDGFGTSLAMVPYRPSGATSTTESLLAVGVPNEDTGSGTDAGVVHIFRVPATGAASELQYVTEDAENVDGEAETGDFYGQRLAAVNSAPNSTTTGTTARLAIGVPGEESAEEHPDKGGVQIVPMVGPLGGSDHWIDPGYGIGDVVEPRMLTGMSLGASPSLLYVGVPYGPASARAVYGFPWDVANGGAPTQTFRPGEGGIPAGGVAFGAGVR
ncbi:FG-GAP repeat domain-containing protein [Streptomyces sp. 4N124]|uniref:FG-GAP repeat domain-containing protein n=1 Tax=Streptomyces sp. 4N124 TaxID=3457420 RepID=UPI003FD03945